MNRGKMATFKMLPVVMNVRAADDGSFANPATACCAATKALWMLTVVSRLNSAREIEKGSSGRVKFATLTTRHQSIIQSTTGDGDECAPLYTTTLGIPNAFFV